MVILKEVKMFPRNSSEGQVSQMGGQVHLVCSVDQISEHQAVLSADRVQQKGT